MDIFPDLASRPGRRSLVVSAFVLIALVFLSTSCEEYDAPPNIELKQPEGGAFLEGESLRLNFDEPIDISTLVVSVWPTERGTSRISLKSDVKPLIESCKPASGSCGDLKLTVDKDGHWAEAAIDGELGIPGLPLILEIHSGLADLEGNETGVSRFFDFQFRVAECGSDVDVDFDDGVYILSATVNDPMTAVLTLVSHMRTLPDGSFALAGAKGQVIGDGPKTEMDPTKIRIPDDETGFALFAKGCL